MTIQLSHTQKKTPWSACPVWASLVSHWIALRILYSVGRLIESIPASSSRTIWCPSSEGKPCCSNNGLGKCWWFFMNCRNESCVILNPHEIQERHPMTTRTISRPPHSLHVCNAAMQFGWGAEVVDPLLALETPAMWGFSHSCNWHMHHRIINKWSKVIPKSWKFLWKGCLKLGWGGLGQCNWYTEVWFV